MTGGGSQTTNTVQKVELPKWLNDASEGTFKGAQAAAAANPIKAYQGPTAAGSNANLDQGSAAARSSYGIGMGDLSTARDLTAAGAAGQTGRVGTDDWNSARMQAYMNPSLEAVQGRTVEAMKRQNKMELDGLGDGMQGMKAYGGTRHAVLEGEARSGQNRNMLDYLAESNAKAYDDSYNKFATDRTSRQGAQATNAGLDQTDLMRQMQAGGQMAGIGQSASGMNSDQINNMVKTGLMDQQTADNLIQGNYNEFLRMQDAPMTRYMQLMGMLSGAPTDRTMTGTETTKKSGGGLLGALLGGAQIAGSIFSDRRLKRDIVRLGEHIAGIGVYAYRYLWGPERHVGVMADEVRAVRPDAVIRGLAGFDMVDYGKLGG